ncbi:hypothetical protein ONS95_001496 [Cadophora gregata]|uniref:uncharacterized protein n=1 Tax=Cadophora gregata TaxID=51156 RepID=UPI0026DCAE20|nr:uncharacterized protein ONS95_001496 [Cadophora gregata]KAK0111120.1 hypothetical protein ONS95_001496 [Cadophora gregata]KAK0112412.1 hypothetical protein ONS96_001656 [Cadophora gregata f. sp. sojae]
MFPLPQESLYLFQVSMSENLTDESTIFRWAEAAVFVDFFGWFKDGSDVFLAMEYVSLGDLEKNVLANSGKIPELEARSIAEQILSGLEIMHAESFAHRDLKPQNVLVVNGSPDWWVKLADFGLSKRLTESTAFNTKGGTQSYMAPEILNYLNLAEGSEQYTNSVDIWAVGCIVYRLITGGVPFPPGKSLVKYCEDKSLFPYDALFDSGIKSEGSKFLRKLLNALPEERPSASQALQHSWIVSNAQCNRMISLSHSISNPSTGSKSEGSSSDFGVQLQDISTLSGLTELSVSDTGYATVTHDGLRSFALSSKAPSGLVDDSSQLTVSAIRRKPVAAVVSDETVKPITQSRAVLRGARSHSFGQVLTVPEPAPWLKFEYGEMESKLVEMIEEHMFRLEADPNFHHELRETLQDTARLDAILSQSCYNKMELRDALKNNAIARLILDIRGLERAIGKLRSGATVDVRPLTLVLEFLRTAMITESSPDLSDLASPQPHQLQELRRQVPREPQSMISSGSAISTATVCPFAVRTKKDCTSIEPGTLQFKTGEIILVTDASANPWWYGILKGQKGYFEACLVNRIPVPTTEALRHDRNSHVRAIFNYTASDPSELSFKEGNLLRLVEAAFKDWWKGEIDGHFGIFPLNYVEVFSPGTMSEETIPATVEAKHDFPQDMDLTTASSHYQPYRPPSEASDMGKLTVEIESASRLLVDRMLVGCEVSHGDHIPFYVTHTVDSMNPLIWNDCFTIDIRSRRMEDLTFTLVLSHLNLLGSYEWYRPPKLLKFPRPDLTQLEPWQRQTFRLTPAMASTTLDIALTFVPCTLTEPRKLVGGKGPVLPLEREPYIREKH